MTPTDPIEETASRLDWPRTEAAQRLVEHLAGRHQMSDETHILILEMESEMTRLRAVEAAARAMVDGNRTSYSQEAALTALREALR